MCGCFCFPLGESVQQGLGGPRGLAGGRTGLSWLLGGIGSGTWHRAAVPLVPVAPLNSPLCEVRPHRPALRSPAWEAGPQSLQAGTPAVLAPTPAAAPLRLLLPVPPADLCLPLAAEAWGAFRGRRNQAFPKTGQPAHMLPVSVQRRSGGHQEEEVGHRGAGLCGPAVGPREPPLTSELESPAQPSLSLAAACIPRWGGQVPLVARRPGFAGPHERAHGPCFLGGGSQAHPSDCVSPAG